MYNGKHISFINPHEIAHFNIDLLKVKGWMDCVDVDNHGLLQAATKSEQTYDYIHCRNVYMILRIHDEIWKILGVQSITLKH